MQDVQGLQSAHKHEKTRELATIELYNAAAAALQSTVRTMVVLAPGLAWPHLHSG